MSTYLYKLIKEGEHLHQDFKFCISDSKKIAKSLVAFANTEGGRLLIGVKDNGRIAGVRTEEEYYMIESAACIYSKPPVKFTTRQWNVEGKTVLEIQVDPSKDKPHFAKDESGKWIAYYRVKDENCIAHKIQVNVWQKSKKPLIFTISDTEKILIDYLHENQTISFTKFVKLAHISRITAEEILTNLIIMKVVDIQHSPEGTSFLLNKKYLNDISDKGKSAI